MLREESIQTLMDLGLSLLQAKTYLALSTLGNATIKQISKTSNIARQDLYRIMPTLQKLGLVTKVIGTPSMFKATPIKEAMSILLHQKTDEYAELQRKTTYLLNNFHEYSVAKVTLQEEETQFIITSELKLLYSKLEKLNQTAQRSIDCVGKWKDFKAAMLYCLYDVFLEAMARGVRIRYVTEEPNDDRSLDKMLAVLEKNPLFEIRYVTGSVPIRMAMHDQQEVNVCVGPPEKDHPNLWSNNPMFVQIIAGHFEQIWNAANKNKRKTAKFSKLKPKQLAANKTQ